MTGTATNLPTLWINDEAQTLHNTSGVTAASVFVQGPAATPDVPVTSVALDYTARTIAIGDTDHLTATIAPSDATNRNVTWTSSNSNVAAVTGSGLTATITAKAAGTATITVTTEDGSKTKTCSVTVPVPVTGVTLNKSATTIAVGGSETLTATIAPSNAANKAVSWSSSNPNVATVTAGTGLTATVTAVSGSTEPAVITVTTADGNKTAACAVTVPVQVTGVALSQTTMSLIAGNTGSLTATIAPADAANKAVSWSSSNTGVATVTAGTGLVATVTAVGGGSAAITVTTAEGGRTATCSVTVTVPVTGVSLKAETTLAPGMTETLVPTVLPPEATNKAVTWSSSSTGVATVNNGPVTAVSTGNATITVRTADGGKTATCAVKVVQDTVPATGVTLNKDKTVLMTGKTEMLVETVSPPNTTIKTVFWTSSDTSVATVAADGTVTGKKSGATQITATTLSGKTATCTVKVRDVYVVGQANLYVGQTPTAFATLWKNGVVAADSLLPDDMYNSIFVTPSNSVYIAGYSTLGANNNRAALWIDGVHRTLPGIDPIGWTGVSAAGYSVIVNSSNKYYVAGISTPRGFAPSDGAYSAVYWSDDGVHALPAVSSVEYARSVCFAGANPLIVGHSGNSAMMWRSPFGSSNVTYYDPAGTWSRFTANSVHISGGGSTFIAGAARNTAGYVHAVYWKDGAFHDLGTGGSANAEATAVSSIGDTYANVYVAGFESNPITQMSRPVLWVDGAHQYLACPAPGYGRANAICCLDGDWFAVGNRVNADGATVAALWINGALHDLDYFTGMIGSGSSATSIFVK